MRYTIARIVLKQSLLITLYSLLSLLITHYSSLITHYSLLITHHSSLIAHAFLQSLSSDVLHEVTYSAGVAPLVVVPGQNLDHVAPDYFGVFGVDDRRV